VREPIRNHTPTGEIDMLKGKTAIVTGSTSGIGLGIARALGGAGANLMLNGFGDAAQIEALRAGLAKEFGIKVAFSGADISKPAQIREMVETGDQGAGLGRHPGQQRGHPAHVAGRRVSGRSLGRRDRHQSDIQLPRDQGRAAADEAPQLGPHRQHRLDHGLIASVEKSAYVAAKHGVLGLTKTVALETAKTGSPATRYAPAGC
jgi:3-hydroxybutyrate dehydrogenase